MRQVIVSILLVMLVGCDRKPSGSGGGSSREVVLYSNRDAQSGLATASTLRLLVRVCVPAHGHSDVLLSARDVSQIPPDLRTLEGSPDGRLGGVLVTEIALADEIGGSCSEAGCSPSSANTSTGG